MTNSVKIISLQRTKGSKSEHTCGFAASSGSNLTKKGSISDMGSTVASMVRENDESRDRDLWLAARESDMAGSNEGM